MRGALVQRGKVWSVVLSTKDDSGKWKQKWIATGARSKKEAQPVLTEIMSKVNKGTYVAPGKQTLGDFLNQWLLDYKGNLSPRGFERYDSIAHVHLIPALGNIPLTQLRPEQLQRFYTTELNKGLSPLTVRYFHVVIHKALQTALEYGIVSRNVADAVKAPKAEHTDMETWDGMEIAHFLEVSIDSPYYALFYTALFTGMRRSEMLALRFQDIDFLLSQVSVSRGLHQLKDGSYVFTQPKSAKSRRTIALSPAAILTLKEHKEKQGALKAQLEVQQRDSDLVFSDIEGKPLRPNTVTRAWAILAERAGLKPIPLHSARHSHASIMLKQGVNPKIVQERLGHATIAITMDIYSSVLPGLQEAAANGFDKMVLPRTEVQNQIR
ncbi:MAG: tyrosine-type recombinase/integrase [Dehalococcoidales bacterium]|nr:tyrosine-type recombinase/integrase [Dehalococcoidales bacterium]